MKILALGDIVSPLAVEELGKRLWSYRKQEKIDFVVANGENASRGNGLDAEMARQILDYGVDVITGGNHIWQKNSLREFLDSSKYIVRPLNFPSRSAGNGYTVVDCSGVKVMVMNVSGTVYMESLSCPFGAVEAVLEREKGKYDVALLDIHAEATGEKYALARYFDGRIHGIFGTHTHVQTADEQILPKGSGYITDLGMCGPKNSILGVKSEIIIEKMITKMPVRFEFAEGEIEFSGVIFDFDTTGNETKIVGIRRIKF
ncbi:MAG: YmdB family metallophosphoesterase [Ruminococcaceae bacterium]|nr:YmdB family metallophosphoesterase [Oscillospiraceae bacterium]